MPTVSSCEAVQASKQGVAQAEDVAGAGDQGHRRQIAGGKTLQDTFRRELWKARRVLEQKPRDGKGRHVYALHAPEMECIASARTRATRRRGRSLHHGWQRCRGWCSWATRWCPLLPAPLVQFGVKASVATTIRRSRGGQFVVMRGHDHGWRCRANPMMAMRCAWCCQRSSGWWVHRCSGC